MNFNWVRFTWDLSNVGQVDSPLPEHYHISPATTEDEKELRRVFTTSFLLDPAWNPAIGEAMQTVQSWLDHAFASKTTTCLALRHGVRIIGATVLSLDPAADNHLAPGPCILMEYRNRSFGTRLLESSLKLLREAGVAQAVGVARENSPVAKFLYPKFRGTMAVADIARLLAA
jgi:acetyltransferase (GNAT) family protein